MLTDYLENAYLYTGMNKRIDRALKYLQETDFTGMTPGRYEVNGSDIYALVQEYQTRFMANCLWEAHKKYIDVQFITEGAEQMAYASVKELVITKSYDPEGDCMLLDGVGSKVVCKAGTFIVFFPQDAHMPCVCVDRPKPVKKVVVKVRV